MYEKKMTPEETIKFGIEKTNLLKSQIDTMDLKQCKKCLKFLAEKTRNDDGSPSVLQMNHFGDDLFIHTLVDCFELAGMKL